MIRVGREPVTISNQDVVKWIGRPNLEAPTCSKLADPSDVQYGR